MSKKSSTMQDPSPLARHSLSQKSTPTKIRNSQLSSSFLVKPLPKPENKKLHPNKIRTLIQSKTTKHLKMKSEKVSPSQSPSKSKYTSEACFPLSANISPNASFRNLSLHLKQTSFCDMGLSESRTIGLNETSKKSKNSSFQSFSNGMLSEDSPRMQEAHKLEIYLNEQLSLNVDKSNEKTRISIYGDVFQLIIDRDKYFGRLMTRIKRAYEDLLNSSSSNDIFRLSNENKTIRQTLSKEIEEKKEIVFKLKKEARKNEKLSKYIEELKIDIKDYQERAENSKRIFENQLNPDQRSWQLLIEDRNKYCDELKAAKKTIHSYRSREKSMKKLLCAIKKRGVPVEDIYETDVQLKKSLTKQITEETNLETTVSRKSRNNSLGPSIPKLKLNKQDSQGSLELNSDEDIPTNEQTLSDGKSSGKSDKVPKIPIPPTSEQGFHQEFVSRVDEFSESWRIALQKEKKF
ncbi:unnamed protein product [Blepharisma stoltei]|uniref:Translin-associated factor X-interacting protein 1 N-terminal domain-containing protein n=1 Tax=Blepharisma stoltei TaxID=1481888 RepID=A0AAU9JUZ8_9CILI|nr:unnamed protein product [Blepharisma stoltei]